MTAQSPGPAWPPDTAERISSARERGASFEAIAQDFGMSFAALRNKAIALGLHTAVPRRRFSPAEDQLIRADYLAHVDVAVTAAKLGRSRGAVRVLIFVDTNDGHVKKASFEAMTYGAKVAEQLGTTAEGVVLGTAKDDLAALGKYGVKKIHHVNNASLDHLDAQVYTKAIADVAGKNGAKVIVFSNNVDGKAIAPRLSARLKAGLVSGAVALPDTGKGFVVKKNVFSGKAFANISLNTEIKIIALNPNAYQTITGEGTAEVIVTDVEVDTPKVKVTAVNKVSGEVPLTEAEVVVSAGRGLKGPENWGMVEELAKVLHAATACSRPVADAHWRPHNEHVGQTGTAIAPTLYIAIGISGAIQHLAGVNRSKVIVVINKDPEAPFFKAADYGIVGDAFEVVPKMTEAIKKIKA